VYRSKLLGFLGAIVLLTASSGATPQDGDAAVHIGPIRWTKDSIANFAVPDGANVVFLGRRPDTAVLVVDPMTGIERRRLPGFIGSTSLGCSPDGTLCLMAGAITPESTASTTLLYNVADGRLLWQKTEQARFMAMSTKLDRLLLRFSDTQDYELRSLTTGETIKRFNSLIEYVFMDEWHQRIYVGTGKWGGEFGNWTVELDATTGQELNKWGLATYGPMCRLKDSDTLLVFGEDLQKPGLRLAKVLGLNVKTGGRSVVLECPENTSDVCGCIGWNILARWTISPDQQSALLHQVRNQRTIAVLARRFQIERMIGSECFINEPIMLFGEPMGINREFVDVVNNNFYYIPKQFICRAIGPTLPVPEPGAPTPLMMVVDGSTLRITPPSDAAGEGFLSITDMSGRLVQRSTVVLGGRPVSVSVGGLPTGSYLCSLQAGSIAATGKFSVVQ